MSSSYGDPRTRVRILDVALQMAAELGPSMRLVDVCRAADVSHQGLYLHFGGRDGLLVAMLPHMVETYGLKERYQEVVDAPDGVEALRRMVVYMGQLNQRLNTIGWVLEEAQHLDEAFAADWRRRVTGLRQAIEMGPVARLASAGRLRRGWTASDAADLILAATTLGSWREMTREIGRSPEEWVELITRVVEVAVVD